MTAASVLNQRWFLRLSRLRLIHQYFSLVRHVEMSLQAKLDNQEKKNIARLLRGLTRWSGHIT